jgi:outer membrane lipopolysaccharide assembly protein LptE/RlpB
MGEARLGKMLIGMLALWVLLGGCNYRFAGGGELPGKISTVAVPIFENRTSETGVESQFTNDLIFEMNRNGRAVLDVNQNPEAILTGIIRSVRIEPVSRTTSQSAVERRIRFSVDMKLTGSDGRIIWQRRGITDNQTYSVVNDQIQTNRNKQEAIVELSQRLAERIHNTLVENF